MLLNTEMEPEMVRNTEVKLEMTQNTEVNSEMVQNTEVKSGMFQSTEEESVMIQKSQSLQNMEAKCVILQNTEVKSGMDQDIEANPDMIQNTEVKSGNLQNTEVKSRTLQHTDAKMGILQADGSRLNTESDNCIEVSKVITNSKVPGMVMQEVAQETRMSERSTDCSELEEVSEVYFNKTNSDMLLKTKEGIMNETTELKEEENIQLLTHTEKGLEGEIKTGSWNGCGHNEGQGKADVIETVGSGSLSDGVAAAIVPEEKQES
jgi:hypothetical protein